MNKPKQVVQSTGRGAQAGLTLIELMVALALGLLIVGAAVATLLIGRQGYSSVDNSTQLRENGRFASTLIEKSVIEAGFENAAYGVISTVKPAGVRGFDNSVVTSLSTMPGSLAHGTRTSSSYCSAGGADTSCATNLSDVLMVRFWGSSIGGAGLPADGTMVDCAGIAEPWGTGSDPRAYSIFHVALGASGEPVLACTYRDSAGNFQTVPLVQGVESFQVLYGVTGSPTPGICAGSVVYDAGIVTKYVSASQLDGPGGSYCENNWKRVRELRIGLLMRGPVGSALTRTSTTWNLLSATDTNVIYPFAPTLTTAADGRLRQQLVFNVHLRNAQYSP